MSEANKVSGIGQELVSIGQDVNNVLAEENTRTGKVSYLVGNHYTDAENEIYGIEQLIESILRSHGAVFPRGAENTEMRAIVIASSMLFADLEHEVREAFCKANERYPKVTLRVYLSKSGSKQGKGKNLVGFMMKGHEDTERTSPKPRARYYLAE